MISKATDQAFTHTHTHTKSFIAQTYTYHSLDLDNYFERTTPWQLKIYIYIMYVAMNTIYVVSSLLVLF